MKKRLFSMLVLLAAVVSGAWAQDTKHLITATHDEQTRSLEQPLPYATTIGEFYEAVTGKSFSDLINTMSALEMPLTGITSNNTSVVSIGDLNGASTPVTVKADGKATVGINFGGYAKAIFVNVVSPLYAYVKDGVKDADKWTVKVGEGQAQALPVGGLSEGDAVTLQYNGRLKVKSVKAVEKGGAQATPLTMEALTAGTIVVYNPQSGMQYTLNGGAKTAVTSDAINVAAGDKVAFYGNGTSISNYNSINLFDGTIITGGSATVKVYGNIMSLIDETGYATLTTLPNRKDQEAAVFGGLFFGNANLTDASGLLLPAIKLAGACYYGMFYGCTSLTAAPELPATTLAEDCYAGMFSGCTSLVTAPALPVTTLADHCYGSMFEGCKSLTTAPALPATELVESCYSGMFDGCTSLTTAPALLAETLAEDCYKEMFYGCTSLVTAPALPAETLASDCYHSMFSGCTSLTTAPELLATTLVKSCYSYMFKNCSNLASVTCLATDISATSCVENWLQNTGSAVQGTKTFYKAASMTGWGTNIPDGWTVEDAPNN